MSQREIAAGISVARVKLRKLTSVTCGGLFPGQVSKVQGLPLPFARCRNGGRRNRLAQRRGNEYSCREQRPLSSTG